jgi:hypothetical protein
LILADSFHAFGRRDYRHCLLFAAIAVESLAAQRLEQEYDSRIGGGPGPEIRLITLPIAGGKIVRKDPVYEALKSTTDFGSLLHQRQLYLFNRSLLIDKPETFRQAKKLYATRNKIAHRGQLSGEKPDSVFALTRSDCIAALTCAIDVVEWFNEQNLQPPVDKLMPAEFIDFAWGDDAAVQAF